MTWAVKFKQFIKSNIQEKSIDLKIPMDSQEELKNYLLFVSAFCLVFLCFAVPMILRSSNISRHEKLRKYSSKEIRSGKFFISDDIFRNYQNTKISI